ncbi:MAG: DUF1674 domain-containing protein [Alphaproteobacteria bacterium]|nr:DUF1674 domain-containing protein [Alphaproteobacteria bacterium]
MSSDPERKSDAPPLPLSPAAAALKPAPPRPAGTTPASDAVAETGGPKGPEPTRFGDWERKGRVSDF